MSRHFSFSQVIAIGQPLMPSARQFQLRTPAIDTLARLSDESLPAQQSPELELLGLLNRLVELGQSPQFTFGMPSQRLAWVSFWEASASELLKHLNSYTQRSPNLSFMDWLSRQPIAEPVWQFLSMSIRALSTAKEPDLARPGPTPRVADAKTPATPVNQPGTACPSVLFILIP